MAVSDLVTTPSFSSTVPMVILEQARSLQGASPPAKKLRPNLRDPREIRELSFAGLAPLVRFVRGLPSPQTPFAVENLEYIKALKSAGDDAYSSADHILAESIQAHEPNKEKPFALKNLEYIKAFNDNGGEAYQSADRMVAALVSIATNNPRLKAEPILFLKELGYERQILGNEALIGTRLDQLKSQIPGSKRANGPYDDIDMSEVRELAPVLALAAIDGFIEDTTLRNADHDNEFKLSAQDTSNVLRNIFNITKNH